MGLIDISLTNKFSYLNKKLLIKFIINVSKPGRKAKSRDFSRRTPPSSSASGGLASHPPCAGTATGPAQTFPPPPPPPRLDRILSLSLSRFYPCPLSYPLRAPGRGGGGAARRVAVAEDMEREARDGAEML
jgi:hypothetical protein